MPPRRHSPPLRQAAQPVRQCLGVIWCVLHGLGRDGWAAKGGGQATLDGWCAGGDGRALDALASNRQPEMRK